MDLGHEIWGVAHAIKSAVVESVRPCSLLIYALIFLHGRAHAIFINAQLVIGYKGGPGVFEVTL